MKHPVKAAIVALCAIPALAATLLAQATTPKAVPVEPISRRERSRWELTRAPAETSSERGTTGERTTACSRGRRRPCTPAPLGSHEPMAKLYFHYSTMNAGKSTLLLQASHNYVERGMQTYLMIAALDDRAGQGRIGSRIGISAEADSFGPETDLFAMIEKRLSKGPCACVFVDEAQFLGRDQVWQLARTVDDLQVPVMCYGLRVDFRGQLFPGSAALLAIADEMREVRTICFCGKKATMVVRKGPDGKPLTDGAQVQVGGNETYVSLCRKHWREAVS